MLLKVQKHSNNCYFPADVLQVLPSVEAAANEADAVWDPEVLIAAPG